MRSPLSVARNSVSGAIARPRLDRGLTVEAPCEQLGRLDRAQEGAVVQGVEAQLDALHGAP